MQDTLCNNHDTIKFNLNRIKKILKSANYDPQEVVGIINETLQLVRHNKKLGQKLENRARAYRNAIESLGFVRHKTNKQA